MARESSDLSSDPYQLRRFIDAQSQTYERACRELRNGMKVSHWMWFIFPQLRGLGHTETSRRFGISSLDEAKAYLAHPDLGPRLRECALLVTQIQGRSISQIFGWPDELKFRSCITLFSKASDDNAVFLTALEKYFAGQADQLTLELLGKGH